MDKQTQQKIHRIQELLKQKANIERELAGLVNPPKEKVLPDDFSINEEVLQFVKDAGETGISSKELLKNLRIKYPNYGIERQQVSSALAYLKNGKQEISIKIRGIYIDKKFANKDEENNSEPTIDVEDIPF